jgi:SAM-dependent methyltransferase
LNEISELRQLVRLLLAASPAWHAYQTETAASFEAQWKHIPHGPWMLTDPEFLSAGEARMLHLTGKPRAWFKDKTILDAGCGSGRWSILLARMGARVTAFDISASGMADAAKLGADYPGFTVFAHNLLEPIPLEPTFDLVWNFGVSHHTGDTRRALGHATAMVKPGGMLVTMLYGEPQLDRPHEFAEINFYTELRRAISHMTVPQKIAYLTDRFGETDAHGAFDAASPPINDLYRFDEARSWLTAWGFRDIERVLDNRNLHIRAFRA